MQKIGILGGTFDPIHHGHLNLAFEMLEKKNLDEVWFCPAYLNPHKLDTTSSSVEDRLNLVKLAIEGIPQFRLTTIEVERSGPSYTVDTLEKLHKSHPDKEFYLILGEDAAASLPNWRNPERIIQIAHVLVGSRILKTLVLKGSPEICEAIKKGMVRTNLLDISGTEIRERVKNKLYSGHLAPLKVVDYIYAHHLYSNQF